MLLTYKNLFAMVTFCINIKYISIATQDQTSTRANTLLDDADDLQKQLENEARDRMLKPTTVWVFRLPTQSPEINTELIKQILLKQFKRRRSSKLQKKDVAGWDYKAQVKWYLEYPECGGRSQSPIDIPKNGLIKAKAGRKMIFANYNKRPQALYMSNDGNRLRLFGDWNRKDRPMIYGGAANNRRYVFHSVTLHWPSEHSVGGFQYPLESQVLHVSADYNTFDDAINVSRKDRLAFLGVVNLYMYRNYTHCSVESILDNAKTGLNSTITSQPLMNFNPFLKYYASYHGSLTVPPCTEAVIWLIRDQTLPITREAAKGIKSLLTEDFQGSLRREIHPLNDRRIYLFK